MTAKKQSLHEAAAEILKASASSAPAEPQHHLGQSPGEQGDESGLGTGQYLGGDFPDKVAPENYTKDARSGTSRAQAPGAPAPVKQMKKPKLKDNNQAVGTIDAQSLGTNHVVVDGGEGHHHEEDPQLENEELDILVDDEGNVFDAEGNHIPGLFVTEEGDLVAVDENGEILSEEDLDEEVLVDEEGNIVDAEGNIVQPAAEEDLGEEEAVVLFDREALYEDFKKNLDADLGSLLEGDAFSDDEKNTIRTVFEAAVMARVDQMADVLEEAFMSTLSESVEEVKNTLAEKTEDYLNYVAEEWMKENEVAVEQGLRTELTEDFINGLKALFQEHFIDIPDDKIDVVEELTEEVAQAEAKLNEQIGKNVELSKKVKMFEAAEVFATVCENLSDVQVDKMRQLAEGIEFIAADDFKNKLVTLRDNYFNGGVKKLTEGTSKRKAADGGLNEVLDIEEASKQSAKTGNSDVDLFVKALDRAGSK